MSTSTVTRARMAQRQGRPSFGMWLCLPGTQLARSCANASPNIDWIILDCEHGLHALQGGAQEVIMAIALSCANPPSPLVRIPAADASDSTAWQIKLALDGGAHGVICPMVRIFTMSLTCLNVLKVPMKIGFHSGKSARDRSRGAFPPSWQARSWQSFLSRGMARATASLH